MAKASSARLSKSEPKRLLRRASASAYVRIPLRAIFPQRVDRLIAEPVGRRVVPKAPDLTSRVAGYELPQTLCRAKPEPPLGLGCGTSRLTSR